MWDCVSGADHAPPRNMACWRSGQRTAAAPRINAASPRTSRGCRQVGSAIYTLEVDANFKLDDFERPSNRQNVTGLACSQRSQTSVRSPDMYLPRANVPGEAGVLQWGQDNPTLRICQRAKKS